MPDTAPLESVLSHWEFPFPFYEFQKNTINELGTLDAGGYYLDVGAGKTATSTASALYRKLKVGATTYVVMPPILIRMWKRWLSRIKPAPSVLVYAGPPKKRMEMKFDTDFVLMSHAIFKKDYDRIVHLAGNRPKTLIVDEATSIKNVSTDNHKSVVHFKDHCDSALMLLTGTPLTTPADAYAYVKLVAPGTYRNLRQFENIHVGERDFFGNVTKWQHLDLLHQNMKINAVRILREDVLKELPDVTFTPLYYELAPAHYAVYKKLATEELLELESGGKIDATQASALFNALAQIVCNPDHFLSDPNFKANIFELIEEILDELGDRKLIVVAKYRMTNRSLVASLAKYGAVAVFGDLTTAQQNRNIERFVNDPACRVLALQPTSGGYGVDGLQHVCHDMIFAELPDTPAQMTQVVARLQRGGQHDPVHVRLAVAEKTLQVRRLNQLMDKDALVNTVIRSYKDLRDAIFGD